MSGAISSQHRDVGTAALRNSGDHPARPTIHRRVSRLAAVCRKLAKRYLIRRAMQELNELDDRILKDIGIERSQIESIVRHGCPRRPLRAQTGVSWRST